MHHNGIGIAVLIKGRPISEFPHNGQVFVEGREGSPYEIEVRNDNQHRVEAVISVDGLSVLDGKDAGVESRGYIIEPRSKVVVPGWRLNGSEVARFQFGGKGESYTQAVTGSAANTGVIGVMAFREQPMPPVYAKSTFVASAFPAGGNGPQFRSFTATRRVSGDGWSAAPLHNGGIGAASIQSMAGSNGMMTSHGPPDVGVASASAAGGYPDVVQQNLGTAFGEAADFQTHSVSFTRGDMLSMMVLYYDDARGLRRRGIVLTRPSRRDLDHRPEAFPGMTDGCQPPAGWRRGR